MKMAAAQNAVIIEDDGRMVRFHPRCPKCGFVDLTSTRSSNVGNGIHAHIGSCYCRKCHERFKMFIAR